LGVVLTLRNDRAELAKLAAWVADAGRRGGWSPRRMFRVDLTLAEAFANVIAHAFPEGGAHEILIELEDEAARTTARLSDHGSAFDPLSSPLDPLDTSLESATPGGWGLHLIRHYADDCSYQRSDGRNLLTLAFLEEAGVTPSPAPDDAPSTQAGAATHPLLRGIPRPTLDHMLGLCRTQQLAPHAVLLTPGEPNHTLYFVLTGKLRVHIGDRDSPATFVISAGEIVGEMSIIEGKPVSAWVLGEASASLLAMPEEVFWTEFAPLPEARRHLFQFLIARVRNTDAVLQQELERRVRFEHLQRDLASAAKIQANILPSLRPLLRDPRVEVEARMKPAREVSGDFYDAVQINDQTVAVAVGDVSGKGLPAALFMVRVITLLRMLLERESDPAAVLPALNRILCDGNDEFMFVTLAVLVLDTRTGAANYLNGGHNPPFLTVGGHPAVLANPPAGPLLGVQPQAKFEVRKLNLSPGDAIYLYTDGVTEAENRQHEQFTVERTAAALHALPANASTAATVSAIEAAVAAFTGDAPLSDDITQLALRYLGPSGAP